MPGIGEVLAHDFGEDPAGVLTPMPGIEVRTSERGWASTRTSTWLAICARWVVSAASCPARIGTTVAAASVPATTTVCCPNAVKISSVRVSANLGACLRSRALT